MNETLGFDFVEIMKAGTYDAKVNKKLQIDVSGLPSGTVLGVGQDIGQSAPEAEV